MPPTAAPAIDEPTFSQRVKERFQPTPPAREVDGSKPPEMKEPETPPVKEPPVSKEPPKEPAPAKGPEKTPAAPASEEDAVFGKTVTKATEAKKTEKPNDEDFEKSLTDETKGMPEKAQEKWIKLRRSEKAAKEEAATARAEMQAAAEANQAAKVDAQSPKLEALTKERDDLKAQLAEAEKTLSITQVERSKKYRETVSAPMEEATKQAEEIAARYEVSPKAIIKALEEEPAARVAALKDLVADFEEADRVDIYQIGKDMDRLRKTAEKLREKAKTDHSAIEDEERAETEREQGERRQTLSASAQRAWDEAAATLDFLKANPAAPDWTKALSAALQQAENYVPGQDAAQDGRLRAQAAQHPFLVKAIQHKDKTIAALTEERDRLLARIEAENALDPDLGGSRDGESIVEDEGDENLTTGQRAAKRFGKR